MNAHTTLTSSQIFEITRKGLRDGAKAVRGKLYAKEIAELSAQVISARPEKLLDYAFRTGKNAVIDKRRAEESKDRRHQREMTKAIRGATHAATMWQHEMERQAAREQFAEFVEALPPTKSTVQRERLEMLRLRVLEGVDDNTLAKVFPGSTRNQRDQWKRQGLLLCLANNPPEQLRRTLERSTVKRQST
jgi:hypothetical protein